jgi:hypothetical protein
VKISDYVNENESEELELVPPGQTEDIEQPSSGGIDVIALLKSPTGEGDVDEYMQHVLNFNESRGMARVIRGLTGMLGNLNYAIVDIVVGVMELAKGRKKAVAVG